jgi:hypothetical protein
MSEQKEPHKEPRMCATCKYFKWDEGRICTAITEDGNSVAFIDHEGGREGKAVLRVSSPFFCALHAFQGEEGVID